MNISVGRYLSAVALLVAVGANAQAPANSPELGAFSARFQVQWRGINVGTSDLELKAANDRGEFEYLSRSNARGVFRLVAGDEITQISRFVLRAGHVQPLTFRGDDGSSSTEKDVTLEFDWTQGRVKGISEDKPVDLSLKPDTQDPMSVQIELMLALQTKQIPKIVWLADKDEVKEFNYTDEGHQRLKTALGELDTQVLASQRPGSSRTLRLWFAPSLGFVPVQAQRTRDGKTEFTMTIKTLKR